MNRYLGIILITLGIAAIANIPLSWALIALGAGGIGYGLSPRN